MRKKINLSNLKSTYLNQDKSKTNLRFGTAKYYTYCLLNQFAKAMIAIHVQIHVMAK